MAQLVVSGLAAGSLYAFLAVGLVMVFKSTGIVNFAQGQMALASAYLVYYFAAERGLPYAVAIVLSLFLSSLLALVIDRIAIRPIMGSSVFTAIMMTLGINITLNAVIGLIWGPFSRKVPSPWPTNPLEIGGVVIAWENLAVIVISAILAVAFYLLFKHTLIGYFMSAVAQDRILPLYLGISLRKVYAITWAVAGVVGGLAGTLVTQATVLNQGVMDPILMKGFTAAVIGGLTSVPGAFAGGLILGVLENLVAAYLSTQSKELISFVIIFAMLSVRPEGLFGTTQYRRI